MSDDTCSTGAITDSFSLADLDDAAKFMERVVSGENVVVELACMYAELSRLRAERRTAGTVNDE